MLERNAYFVWKYHEGKISLDKRWGQIILSLHRQDLDVNRSGINVLIKKRVFEKKTQYFTLS